MAGHDPMWEKIANPALLNDYAGLCAALRVRDWDVGLVVAPDPDALPALWAAFAQAGIATLCGDLPFCRDLARQGAAALAMDGAWPKAAALLAADPTRCAALVRGANALLETRYSWARLDEAMLSLLERAAALRRAGRLNHLDHAPDAQRAVL